MGTWRETVEPHKLGNSTRLGPKVVVVTLLLPRDGGKEENHGGSETGKIPIVWTKGRRGVTTERAAQRGRRRTRQHEMKGVLNWMTRGSHEEFSILSILEAYKFNRRLCSLQRRRQRTLQAKRSTSSSVDTEVTCESKNINETVRLQSEKRYELTGEEREKLHGTVDGWSSKPYLADSFGWVIL